LRLKTITFFILTVLALLPSLVISAVIYKKVYGLAESSITRELELVADQINAEVLHKVELLATGLELLSHREVMLLGIDNLLFSSQALGALEKFGDSSKLIDSLYLISEDGFVIESYKGNILPMEDFYVQNELESRTSFTFGNNYLLTSPWIEHFENPNLIEEKGDGHGLAFFVPIYSDNRVDEIKIHGYLIAIVSIDNILTITGKIKTAVDQVSFTFLGEIIGGHDVYDAVTQSNRLGVTGRGFRNALWLDLNVAQPKTTIVTQIKDLLQPMLSSVGILFIILVGLALFIAQIFSGGFNQLNMLIQRFESGGSLFSKPFFILEFNQITNLLRGLQKTINSQMKKLEDKNTELAKVNSLREKYLSEVRDLNADLEQKVDLRTKELARTLSKVEQSHFVFEQLIQFRRLLESCSGNRAVAKATFTCIKTCLNSARIALYLPQQASHRSIASCANIEQLDFFSINSQLEACHDSGIENHQVLVDGVEQNVTTFSAGAGQFAWLMIYHDSAEIQQANWVALFIAELNSYLLMRSLNENLDKLANTDALTGLFNRKAFDQLMSELGTQLDAQVGLYIIDVNGLKAVNDNQGHEEGDELIKKAGEILLQCAQGITIQVFRIGGDEFAIILSAKEFAQAELLANNMTAKQPSARFKNNNIGEHYALSFSFGYASTEESVFSLLYTMADRNMYINKQNYYKNHLKN